MSKKHLKFVAVRAGRLFRHDHSQKSQNHGPRVMLSFTILNFFDEIKEIFNEQTENSYNILLLSLHCIHILTVSHLIFVHSV